MKLRLSRNEMALSVLSHRDARLVFANEVVAYFTAHSVACYRYPKISNLHQKILFAFNSELWPSSWKGLSARSLTLLLGLNY